MSEQKVLIIGSGSMGQRFAELLNKRGYTVVFFKYKKDQPSLKNLKDFKACFICSPTSTHLTYLKKCLSAGLHIFIEKPISSSLVGLRAVLEKKKPHQMLMVGFNSRLILSSEEMKKTISQLGSISYAHFDVGQNLESWRPTTDCKKSYSAHFNLGGGVTLDLIHEIDLALNFFPDLVINHSVSNRLGDCTIDSEDYSQIEFTNPRVRITLDYLSHRKIRTYHLVGENGTLWCDIINKKFEVFWKNGTTTSLTDPILFDREGSFERELEYFFNCIDTNNIPECTDRYLGIDALSIALKVRKKYVQKI